jgi:hypothetical protein
MGTIVSWMNTTKAGNLGHFDQKFSLNIFKFLAHFCKNKIFCNRSCRSWRVDAEISELEKDRDFWSFAIDPVGHGGWTIQ